MVELRNIHKEFYKKDMATIALSDISLSVADGQIFGIIGASGAGKSTLIRCVNLLEKPTSGEVWIGGRNLTDLSFRQLIKARRDIGMIFQHFNLLFSRTVRKNVALPLELIGMPQADIERRVTELLLLVGLEKKGNEYPSNLSGGQKQRVAIARALATNPKLLLCDEVTSALDPATTASILSLLKDINKRFDITILLITHEMNVVRSICDQVALISEGRIVQQGSVEHMLPYIDTRHNHPVDLSKTHTAYINTQSVENRYPVVRLIFEKNFASTAILSEVSHRYSIHQNILHAQIYTDAADHHGYGTLIIELAGNKADTEKALNYYQSQLVNVEVLGNA